MQLKIFKKATAFLAIIIVFTLCFIIGLILYRDTLGEKIYTICIIYFIISIIVTFLYVDYDLHAAQRIVEKKVRNNQIALACITSGQVERSIRDSRFFKQVLWKLEIKVYDRNLNCFTTKCIEKFSIQQTKIPQGNVYVTYDPIKPDEIFIIPTIMIQMTPSLAPLVQKYENNLKINYLHCYYNHGLILQTYKEVLKEQDKK
ncbi:MAG: hypothetical protein Q4C64_01595 [Erysipelotrichia bacterium]|nr:hypothetical protein [Erysipelotrichia bacterium]